MKISKSIIDKYQLIGEAAHIGVAILHDLKSFKSSLPGFENIILFECDFSGYPCKDITFLNKSTRRAGILTLEFMMNMPIEIIRDFVCK